jgi:hypothetical protein
MSRPRGAQGNEVVAAHEIGGFAELIDGVFPNSVAGYGINKSHGRPRVA